MKISVCMTTYNGEKYVFEQVQSILVQLSSTDELVIVDDCSTDNTLSIIKAFDSENIRVINNSTNLGIIKSFELALKNTSGDIIFFSDQDDVWLPSKVAETVEYMTKTKASAIVSDARVIDEYGNILYESFFGLRKSGSGFIKNFFMNGYIGCCMTIDSKVKKYILPFPSYIPMHDEWIGMVCEFLDGVYFLPQQLQEYRRHSENQTSIFGKSLIKIISKRLKIFRIVLTEFPKIFFKYNYLMNRNSCNNTIC